MNLVLDASAIVALLRTEDGAETVRELVDDESHAAFVHVINLCEVYYGFRRDHGEDDARGAIEAIESMSIICDDMDTAFWQQAGRLKADLRRISLADCFCLALALRLDGEVLTTDRRELGPVAQQGLCRIRFIR